MRHVDFCTLVSDWNGDRGVSVFDFSTFSYWFGTGVPRAPVYVDANGDGGVSVFDFGSFSARFGEGVVFPALAAHPQLAGEVAPRQQPVRADETNDDLPVIVQDHQRRRFPVEGRGPVQIDWLHIEQKAEIQEDLLDILADDVFDMLK